VRATILFLPRRNTAEDHFSTVWKQLKASLTFLFQDDDELDKRGPHRSKASKVPELINWKSYPGTLQAIDTAERHRARSGPIDGISRISVVGREGSSPKKSRTRASLHQDVGCGVALVQQTNTIPTSDQYRLYTGSSTANKSTKGVDPERSSHIPKIVPSAPTEDSPILHLSFWGLDFLHKLKISNNHAFSSRLDL
jgi:hypothetical protein